jgi:flagellar basal body rod protein FlgC
MDFIKTLAIAASGLRAQAGRMRVISENIANADSTAQSAGGWDKLPALVNYLIAQESHK